MEKHARFGLLASLALHVLPAGMWWLQPPSLPLAANGPDRERVMEVRLQFGHGDAIGGGLPADLAELPVTDEPVPDVLPSTSAQGPVPALFPKEPPYIPAGELDARPSPETPVVVPFPDAALGAPKAAGVLVLYIGADGRVDRVEIDESDLPADFERVAIDTFLQARMRPGILNGQPTRARMKILVEFEQR